MVLLGVIHAQYILMMSVDGLFTDGVARRSSCVIHSYDIGTFQDTMRMGLVVDVSVGFLGGRHMLFVGLW